MMKTGPALRTWDSHSSIHEAALGEAQELTDMIAACLRRGEREQALHIAYIAVEHWETRTLRHAESEEEGLYPELRTSFPGLHDTLVALTRDHALLRLLVQEIKQMLAAGDVGPGIVHRLHALILIDLLHNQEEERVVTGVEGLASDLLGREVEVSESAG